jgi:uncharacterized Zn-finger protein
LAAPPTTPPHGKTIQGKTMTPFETIEIGEMVAACNGGGGPLGHPRVYLNLAPAGWIECPYCSRRYINPAVAQAGGVAEEVGVVTQSAHGPGGEHQSESPAPRQVGATAEGNDASGGRP